MNDPHDIETHRAKGEYAKYKIKSLATTHLIILEVLNEAGKPVTTREIVKPANEKRQARGEKGTILQPQITGRLSELGRVGLVEMHYADVRVVDEEIPSFRFRKTPVWVITEKGREALKLGKIPRAHRRRT